jgi:hypothetical protein
MFSRVPGLGRGLGMGVGDGGWGRVVGTEVGSWGLGCKLMEYRLRARDAAHSRREDRKAMLMADRRAADEERLMERKAKESSTMDM